MMRNSLVHAIRLQAACLEASFKHGNFHSGNVFAINVFLLCLRIEKPRKRHAFCFLLVITSFERYLAEIETCGKPADL